MAEKFPDDSAGAKPPSFLITSKNNGCYDMPSQLVWSKDQNKPHLRGTIRVGVELGSMAAL